jgi:transketolase N-terminal domain/subunit
MSRVWVILLGTTPEMAEGSVWEAFAAASACEYKLKQHGRDLSM